MVKVVVAGAAGGIGQPLSYAFKTSPPGLIDELALYDVANVEGVGADLSHVSTHVKSKAYPGPPLPMRPEPAPSAEDKARWEKKMEDAPKNQELAFKGADLVIVPAGMPRLPGMTRDQLFDKNAEIIRGIAELIAKYAPKALVLIISNPVNSMVPLVKGVLEKEGVFNAQRLFGVTTLDVVRAKTFVSELADLTPQEVNVPVIGGHSGHTILPIFSQTQPETAKKAAQSAAQSLIPRIQYGGDEVVKAKDLGSMKGSATLSMAYAGYSFAEKVLRAAKGEKGIVECTYINLAGVPGGDAIEKDTGTAWFSTPVELGPNGAEKAINILDKLDSDEKELLNACIKGAKGEAGLGGNIEKAETWWKNKLKKEAEASQTT